MSKNPVKKDILKQIYEMEGILDEAVRKMDALEEGISDYQEFQSEIRKLEEYYTSQQWKDAFAMDEKGEFPENMKRGVLSEDGIYNVLERNKELLERIKADQDHKETEEKGYGV